MHLSKVKAFIVFASFMWLGCSSEKEESEFRMPENAAALLAGKTSKTWKLAKRMNGKMRVNMGDCTLAYRQTFSFDGKVTDNNAANQDCGPSVNGHWHFSSDETGRHYVGITSDQIPVLFKVKEGSKTKFFQIVALTDSFFVYRFKHELFSNQSTIIQDVLVREDIAFEGRDFHW